MKILANHSSTLFGVDAHAHVFLRDLPRKASPRHSPHYDATLDAYIGLLDCSALRYGVLVQPSFLGTDNDYMLQALRAYPQRLRGVAVVDPHIDMASLQNLAADGIVGIRLNLMGLPLPDFNNPSWRRLFERVAALGWHVELHRAAGDLPRLLPALQDAGCNIVIDHFGRPDITLNEQDPGFRFLLEQIRAYGRIWVKLSASYRTWQPDDQGAGAQAQRVAQILLAVAGPSRLMWASDWPHTQHQHVVDFEKSRRWLDDWIPDAADRNVILHDTPIKLFQFEETYS